MLGQDKNTIKAVIATIAAVIVGEGILGWGLYWPFLFLLLDWSYVFWLGLLVGILVSAFNGFSIGWTSLAIVIMLGVASVFSETRKSASIRLVIMSLLANFVFDLIFGLRWSIWELVGVLLVSLLVLERNGPGESIKVRYK